MQESIEEAIIKEGGLDSAKKEVELSPAINKEDPVSLQPHYKNFA